MEHRILSLILITCYMQYLLHGENQYLPKNIYIKYTKKKAKYLVNSKNSLYNKYSFYFKHCRKTLEPPHVHKEVSCSIPLCIHSQHDGQKIGCITTEAPN